MQVLEMFEDIIANFAIVTAYLFFANQVIFRRVNLGGLVTTFMKIKLGMIHGVVGTILMFFTVHMNDTILDFRQIAVILSALYGGVLSSVITGVLICIMRIVAFGTVTQATVIAAANTIAVAIAVGIACTRASSYRNKWVFSILVSTVFTGAVFINNFGEQGVGPMFTYGAMMALGGIMTAKLTSFFMKAKAYTLQMEKEANIDFLTGLNNHRSFDAKFHILLATAVRKSECLSVAVIDIDFFKKINDTYGHANGDIVLKQLSELLQSSARPFDTLSRNGGEEFSVLLYDTPHEHSLLIAERIRSAVCNYTFVLNQGEKLKITVSIGVATYPHTAPDELMEQADQALYQAKSNGRNQVCSNLKL